MLILSPLVCIALGTITSLFAGLYTYPTETVQIIPNLLDKYIHAVIWLLCVVPAPAPAPAPGPYGPAPVTSLNVYSPEKLGLSIYAPFKLIIPRPNLAPTAVFRFLNPMQFASTLLADKRVAGRVPLPVKGVDGPHELPECEGEAAPPWMVAALVCVLVLSVATDPSIRQLLQIVSDLWEGLKEFVSASSEATQSDAPGTTSNDDVPKKDDVPKYFKLELAPKSEAEQFVDQVYPQDDAAPVTSPVVNTDKSEQEVKDDKVVRNPVTDAKSDIVIPTVSLDNDAVANNNAAALDSTPAVDDKPATISAPAVPANDSTTAEKPAPVPKSASPPIEAPTTTDAAEDDDEPFLYLGVDADPAIRDAATTAIADVQDRTTDANEDASSTSSPSTADTSLDTPVHTSTPPTSKNEDETQRTKAKCAHGSSDNAPQVAATMEDSPVPAEENVEGASPAVQDAQLEAADVPADDETTMDDTSPEKSRAAGGIWASIHAPRYQPAAPAAQHVEPAPSAQRTATPAPAVRIVDAAALHDWKPQCSQRSIYDDSPIPDASSAAYRSGAPSPEPVAAPQPVAVPEPVVAPEPITVPAPADDTAPASHDKGKSRALADPALAMDILFEYQPKAEKPSMWDSSPLPGAPSAEPSEAEVVAAPEVVVAPEAAPEPVVAPELVVAPKPAAPAATPPPAHPVPFFHAVMHSRSASPPTPADALPATDTSPNAKDKGKGKARAPSSSSPPPPAAADTDAALDKNAALYPRSKAEEKRQLLHALAASREHFWKIEQRGAHDAMAGPSGVCTSTPPLVTFEVEEAPRERSPTRVRTPTPPLVMVEIKKAPRGRRPARRPVAHATRMLQPEPVYAIPRPIADVLAEWTRQLDTYTAEPAARALPTLPRMGKPQDRTQSLGPVLRRYPGWPGLPLSVREWFVEQEAAARVVRRVEAAAEPRNRARPTWKDIRPRPTQEDIRPRPTQARIRPPTKEDIRPCLTREEIRPHRTLEQIDEAAGERRPQSLERYRARHALPDTAFQERTQSLGPVRERYIGGLALPGTVLEWFERDGPDEVREAELARAAALGYKKLWRKLPGPKKEEEDEVDRFRLAVLGPKAAAAKAAEEGWKKDWEKGGKSGR